MKQGGDMNFEDYFPARNKRFRFIWAALALGLGLGFTLGLFTALAKHADPLPGVRAGNLPPGNAPVGPGTPANFTVNTANDSHDANPRAGVCADLTNGVLPGTASVTVTVLPVNDPPLVDVGPDRTANEGELLRFTGVVTDVDNTTFDLAWNFGDDSALTGTLTPTHAFLNDGAYTVTLTVTDTQGGVGQDALLVTVANVAPIMGDLAGLTVTTGLPFSLTIAFSDPGLLDPHTVIIFWSDQVTETLELAAGVFQVAASHIFTEADIYTLTVLVTDDSGDGSFGRCRVIVLGGYPIYLPVVVRLSP
jgi:hypothetical protein